MDNTHASKNPLVIRFFRERTFKEVLPFLKPFIKKIVFSILFVCVIVSLYSLLYFGCGWNVAKEYHTLKVSIVNADEGISIYGKQLNIGDIVKTISFKANSTAPENSDQQIFHWIELSNQTSFEDASHQVHTDRDLWGNIYIPKDFTSIIFQGLFKSQNLSAIPYDNHVIFTYDQAKQYTASSVVSSYSNALITGASRYISGLILSQKFGPINPNPSNPHQMSAVIDPCPIKINNIHPIYYYGRVMLSTSGIILLWLGALFTANIQVPVFLIFEKYFKTWTVMAIKYIYMFSFSLILSMCLLLVSESFGGTYEKGWFAYWMWNWFSMLTFISILDFVNQSLGPLGNLVTTPLLVILLTSGNGIVSNVLQNKFFLIGEGLPFFYAVEGSKTILFGTTNRLGLDIGVLFIYFGFFTIINVFLNYRNIEKRVKSNMKDVIELQESPIQNK